MTKPIVKAWKFVAGAVSFVGGIVGIAWWFGITPEIVGDTVYGISHAVLPFVMIGCGFALGWIVKSCLIDVEVAKAEAAKRIEFEEAEKRKMDEIRSKFESLNLGAADVVSLAHGERNGFKMSASSDKSAIVRRRADVFVISNKFADPLTVFLTPEWNTLMNEHGDIFHEMWGPRKSEAYIPHSCAE